VARKNRPTDVSVNEAGEAAVETRGPTAPAEEQIDPVSADPAVILWDEVKAPEQPGEDAQLARPAGNAPPDKALH
jgi:hypothetical protein